MTEAHALSGPRAISREIVFVATLMRIQIVDRIIDYHPRYYRQINFQFLMMNFMFITESKFPAQGFSYLCFSKDSV